MKLMCKLFGHKYNIPSDRKLGWERIDNSYKNLPNQSYRIVEGKTLGGETKYFVEKRYGNKWMAFESFPKETIDEARKFKNWLIADDEQKINNKILEKKEIE